MNRLLRIILAILSAVGIFYLSSTTAQGDTPAVRKVRLESKLMVDSSVFTMKIDPKQEIAAGKTFKARVHVKHNPKWHIYSSQMDPNSGLPILEVSLPPELENTYKLQGITEEGKMKVGFDSNFDAVTKAYYGDFDIIANVKVLPKAKLGKVPFSLYIKYGTCSESICLPPRTFVVPMTMLGQKEIQLNIAEATDTTGTTDTTSIGTTESVDTSNNSSIGAASTTPPSQGDNSKGTVAPAKEADVLTIASESIWSFIWYAAGFGLLALLTPCVFPMVPITVSFFTKRNAGSKKEAVKDATLYAFGIIITFVALGFLLSLVAGPAGINKFAANPWMNIVIGVIFIAFALNLFGLFELGLPSSVLTSLNTTAQKSKSRVASVMLMGLVFSLTSFTCTVPFVGTLMVAFSRGAWFVPWFVPLIGMVVFAGVFALPFFLLALFPSLMKSLPRSGGWLNSVKVVMGFVEVAAALKFFSNADLIWTWHVLTRDVVLAAWVAIAVLTTFYLLGRFRLSHDSPVDHIGAIRVMIAVVFLSIGVYLYTGINGKPLGQLDAFLPPAEYGGLNLASTTTNASVAGSAPGTQEQSNEKWFASYPEALAEAKRTGKNIFIDFTGYTCTNCRAMEATVFSKPDVKDIFKNFVLARLYTDDGSPLNDSNRVMEESRFNTIALPFYVIMSPEDKALNTFPGFTRDREEFKTFLMAHSKVTSHSPAVAMAGN